MSSSLEQQLERLKEVFGLLKEANLKLKPSKCSLFRREVEFLGHVVSSEGIAMQRSKVKAVNTWPTPKSLTELRAFLGAVEYYRRFIKDFFAVASPLFQLLKKDTSWEWTEERQQAFDDLKSRLVQEPILALLANEGQYILDTDASDFGLGAVLSQIQNDEEKVIA